MTFSNLFLLFARSHFSRLILARSLALPVVKSRRKVGGSSVIWTNIVTRRSATVIRWRQIDRDKVGRGRRHISSCFHHCFRHCFRHMVVVAFRLKRKVQVICALTKRRNRSWKSFVDGFCDCTCFINWLESTPFYAFLFIYFQRPIGDQNIINAQSRWLLFLPSTDAVWKDLRSFSCT